MGIYGDVKKMHRRFGISGCSEQNSKPRMLSLEEQEFRIKCLQEEVQEFVEAENLPEQIDALVDLVVFALGTAERMGVVWEWHWNEVLIANMRKELCKTNSESKRDFHLDLKKPDDWTEPNHTKILEWYK